MPTPTWAALIIFTSLAPSPMARVEILGLLSLTRVTIYYFYLGETLQQRTEVQLLVIARRSYFGPSVIAWMRASPVIIKALLSLTLFDWSKFLSI